MPRNEQFYSALTSLQPSLHALERTSPYGGAFVGRCIRCGRTGLTFADMNERCANTSGKTDEEALLEVIIWKVEDDDVA